jgi:hypothetical protein
LLKNRVSLSLLFLFKFFTIQLVWTLNFRLYDWTSHSHSLLKAYATDLVCKRLSECVKGLNQPTYTSWAHFSLLYFWGFRRFDFNCSVPTIYFALNSNFYRYLDRKMAYDSKYYSLQKLVMIFLKCLRSEILHVN